MARLIRRKPDGSQTVTGHDESRDGRPNEAGEYRDVVSTALGRKLPNDSIVHHRNRKRHENDLENLLLMPNQSIHMLMHSYIKSGNRRLQLELEGWCLAWMLDLATECESAASPVILTLYSAVKDELLETGDSKYSGPELEVQTTYLGQYFSAKAAYPNHIVFIQRGYFYEAFEDDALELASLFSWKTYFSTWFGMLSTGMPVERDRALGDLEQLGRRYVVVAQSEGKIGKILRRTLIRVFDG